MSALASYSLETSFVNDAIRSSRNYGIDATEFNFISEPQIVSSYSKSSKCLWLTMSATQRACFNIAMLNDLNTELEINQHNRTDTKAIVLTSANTSVFSYGGDLNYVRSLIIKNDRQALFDYIKLSLDVIFKFASHFEQLRIAQVSGAAYGAGFEIALASDIIIAERQATFGFPELDLDINLFPCLGAFYYLSRRVGANKAHQIFSSSEIYTAEQLAILGVVDIVVDKGCSTNAVIDYINQQQQQNHSKNSLKQIANRINQAPYSKLIEGCHAWVDNVMSLSGYKLRKIERLVKHQDSTVNRPC